MSFLDLSSVELSAPRGYGALPSGVYIFKIEKAEVKETKNGGQKIDIRLKVTAGEFKNRMVFDSFNIKNSSVEAQRIGKEQLLTMMLNAGMGKVLESVTDLEGREVAAKIAQEKKYDSDDMKNVIKAYMSLSAPDARKALAAGDKSADSSTGWA